MNFKKEELIKSPLNYTGNKFNLLEQILPLFPNEVNTFVDLFGGSGTVSVNIKANNIFYNELNTKLCELIKWCYSCNIQETLLKLDKLILKYKLEKNNKESYYIFRKEYNKNNSNEFLYLLSCYCINYMIRFNKKGEFNQACGNGQFSENMRNNFIKFNKNDNNIRFLNNSFLELKIDKLSQNDFVYLDPPYFLTVASYNENGGWSENLEKSMYELCDKLNDKGIKFAMSNAIVYKNKEHKILYDWGKKYNINELNYQYIKNNLHGKDLNKKDIEVLITNY